ncbi:hypothetical protein RhiirC2_705389 [Rhizophagus irregularis]|uniref:Uncharacterized protein n=1 Tax=Rhizophagus irregularis TaxID=588596 RepID=A0A2N1NYP6_9GLOM|nr:hypothetical protein RhiirC2_705389 [Rhizophagus irregularis]
MQKKYGMNSNAKSGEYHDLYYLKTDVLLLADVWATFRETFMKYNELVTYLQHPILGCDVKIHRSENRTFTDMEMHDFAERARRDGITMTCRRYFKANNPNAKTMTCAVQKHSCHMLMQIIFMDGLHSSHIVPLAEKAKFFKIFKHISATNLSHKKKASQAKKEITIMNKDLKEEMKSGFEEISKETATTNKEISFIHREISFIHKEISFIHEEISNMNKLFESKINLINKEITITYKGVKICEGRISLVNQTMVNNLRGIWY